MRKNMKFLVICAIATAIGMLLTGIGIAAGGMIRGVQIDSHGMKVYAPALDKMENKSDYIKKEEQTESFDSIQVDLEYGDIRVERTDENVYSLSYCLFGNREVQKEIKNGTLLLKQKDITVDRKYQPQIRWFVMGNIENDGENEFVTIYVPKDAKLSNVQLNTESGDVVCGNIQAGNLTIAAEYGDARLSEIQAEEIDIKMESGKLLMEQVQADSCSIKDEYGNASICNLALRGLLKADLESGTMKLQNTVMDGLELKSDYGDVTGQNVDLKMMQMRIESGDCKFDDLMMESCLVNASYGDVELQLKKAVTDYAYRLDTEYGDIKIDGVKMGSAYATLEEDKKSMIEIHCESGNIRIQ